MARAGHFVSLAELGSAPGLTADQRISALAAALEWWAVAAALKMMHGERQAVKRLIELDCPVRFDAAGEPVIWVT